jgi:hypothetical protein
MDIENTFFSYLSERLKHETNLSDITWALCYTSESFKKMFLKYCFDEDIDVSDELIREYSRGDSQPDFYFKDRNKKEYIIENKIKDRGDHFEQYITTFPNARRAFIANYYEPEHNGWKIKTWKAFCKELKNKLYNFSNNEKKLICNYLTYLEPVLEYVEVKPMDLTNISSLLDFYEILKKIADECEVVKLNEYNKFKDAINALSYGVYFECKIIKNINFIFWIGLYFESNEMAIYVLKERCSEHEANILKELKAGKYHEKTIDYGSDEPHFWIPLKKKYYKQLCEKIDVETQKNIIKSFLEEILLKLK